MRSVWNGIFGTLQWLLLLLLLSVVIGGATVLHYWGQADAVLEAKVHELFEKDLPDVRVDFQDATLIEGSRLELKKVTLHSVATQELLGTIPRIEFQFDASILANYHRLVVNEVNIESPEIYCVRNLDGVWSWEGIRRPPPSEVMTPTVRIDNATLRLGFADRDAVRFLTCQKISLELQPEANRRYRMTGTGHADVVGQVDVAGLIDSTNGEWKLTGTAGELRIDNPLIDVASMFVPKIGQEIASVRNQVQQKVMQHRQYAMAQDPFRTASLGTQQVTATSAETPTLLRADAQVNFAIGKKSAGDPLDYKVTADISHGQISDWLLPIPLYDLGGHIEVTPDAILVQRLSAKNDDSQLFVDGNTFRVQNESQPAGQPANWLSNFNVKATNLKMDQRVRSFLPGGLRRLYDLLQPEGTFDLDVDIAQEPGSKPDIHLRQFSARDCNVVYADFAYPVSQGHGTVVQDGDTYRFQFEGHANGLPVKMTGFSIPDRPHKDFHITLEGAGLPIDRKFTDAFQREDHQEIRQTLESLNFMGVGDAKVELIRNDKTHGEVYLIVDAKVYDGALKFDGFPYALRDVSARITFNPFDQKIWYVNQIKGRHGDAHVGGDARFDMSHHPGGLAMQLNVVRIPVDQDLRIAATTANPHLQKMWDEYSLEGTVDVDELRLGWVPGVEPQVILNGIHWRDGKIKPKAFPFQWNDVVGTLTWNGELLKIHSLNGWHGETYFHIDGSNPDEPAFVRVPDSETLKWRLYLENLSVIKLQPNDDLKEALPIYLTEVLDAFELKNSVDVMTSLDLKGWGKTGELVTAAWKDTKIMLSGNSLYAGLPLQDVVGKIQIALGEYDAQRVRMQGWIEIDQVNTLDLPLTNVHGPFLVDGKQVVVGNPQFLERQIRKNPNVKYSGEQLVASVYDGLVAVDAVGTVEERKEDSTYSVEVNVQDVELAEVAKDRGIESNRLMGKVNGTVKIDGQGVELTTPKGEGWVQITPAALYELPVFAQIFGKLFNPISRSNDNTAFNYAYSDFTIHDGLFDFSRIELVGEAMSLVGRGSVGYAGPRGSTVEFDFYSRMNNRIPFLKPLQRFGDSWVRIQVLGTMSQPTAVIQPRIPLLDNAFRGFMQGLEAGTPRRPPQQPTP